MSNLDDLAQTSRHAPWISLAFHIPFASRLDRETVQVTQDVAYHERLAIGRKGNGDGNALKGDDRLGLAAFEAPET